MEKKFIKGVVVTRPGVVEVRDDIPMPTPNDYEALLKVHACGICNGTDLGYINGTVSALEGLRPYPTILGHESSAVVVAVGKKVRNIRVGEKFIHTNMRDNVGNGYTKTHGAMAEYGLIPDVQAILDDGYSNEDIPKITGYGPHLFDYRDGPHAIGRMGDDMDLIDGGVFQSLCESLAAATNLGIKEGDSVLVYGCGPMGISFALFAKLLGAKHVTAIDCVEERLERAKTVSHVDRVINFQKESVAEVLKGELFDVVADVVGKSSILIEGSHYCKCCGVVGSVGVLKKDDICLNMEGFKNSVRLQMLNFPYHSFASFDRLQDMIRRGLVHPKDFYSHVIPVEKIQEALELVRTKKAIKVILKF